MIIKDIYIMHIYSGVKMDVDLYNLWKMDIKGKIFTFQ